VVSANAMARPKTLVNRGLGKLRTMNQLDAVRSMKGQSYLAGYRDAIEPLERSE
jgi:hypothetical protein